jgi:hypothetical protein
MRRVGTGDDETGGDFTHELIGQTYPQADRLAFDRRLITDADDLELFLVTVGSPFDHVPNQSPGQSVVSAGRAFIVRALDDYLLFGIVIFHGDFAAMLPLQLALRAFHVDHTSIHGKLDIRGNGNRFFSKAGHNSLSSKN